jgi:hypothetical protein
MNSDDQWRVGFIQDDSTLHIWPTDEEGDHSEIGVECWCDPLVYLYEYAILVVHNRRQ